MRGWLGFEFYRSSIMRRSAEAPARSYRGRPIVEDSSRTRVCSVLFVDVVGYSKQPVAEQLLLKQAVRDRLNFALDQIDPRERRIQDTGDGAVVVFTGDPEDALFAAMSTRDSADVLQLRLGINLGPVYLSEVSDSQTNMVGDGINAAQRVMSFAEPGQLLVSRSFRDVAFWLSSDYDRLFVPEPSRPDKHGRMHELYSVTTSVRAGRRVAEIAASIRAQRPATSAPKETVANVRAKVFDAGSHLVISGYGKAGVEQALNELAGRGARVISRMEAIGNKWVATCEHPDTGACKVEEFGFTRLVTGPTRELVAAKIGELISFGGVQVGEIELNDGLWTGMCDLSSASR